MTHAIKENHRKCENKIIKGEYDVFISYNAKDREHVLQISEWLKDNGLAPWLDIWDLRPGFIWLQQVGEQIKKCKAAVVCIGKWGIGDWEEVEMYELLSTLKAQKYPVIPVLLENAPYEPDLPPFLGVRTWVDFRRASIRKSNTDPLERLIYGITGERFPTVYRPGVLLASLGESPIVVPVTYDLLAQQEKLTLDRVVVLMPKGGDIQTSFEKVQETMQNVCDVRYEELDFDDADSWRNACMFLRRLYLLLETYQKQGDSVYLSVAGGRKSMSALMAWVVPFFSCVKGLYYAVDKTGKNFVPVSEIVPSQTYRYMHPNLREIPLVSIPFETGVSIEEKLAERLRNTMPDKFEEVEALYTAQTIIHTGNESLLEVRLTKKATREFYSLLQKDKFQAQMVRNALMEMSNPQTLQAHASSEREKREGFILRYFTGVQGPVRFVFHTHSSDIKNYPAKQLTKVVVCSLEMEGTNGYSSLREAINTPGFSTEPYRLADVLPPVASPTNSILIVPLGESPMVATQLYTLLTEQEQRTIDEMYLIYPADDVIDNGAQLIERIFEEYAIACKPVLVPIPGLFDVASEDDCRAYQTKLEETIANIKKRYPNHKIDLALSGGRRGMTAMTIFAAQKEGIPYVYHTLVTDKDIKEQTERDGSFEYLNDTAVNDQERYDILFLEKYRAEELYPYEHFTLFRVPVFSEAW